MKTFSLKIVICLFLIILTIGVYGQTGRHDQINADDFYITTNPHIHNAYSYEGFTAAMTSLVAGIWMPVTYLFIGIEMELFDTDFGPYHTTAAVLHAVNAVIVFLLLFNMTGAPWKSALVAAVFAVHPVNVEAVAWLVGIRVLVCVFFCLLTLYAYSHYVSRPSSARYAATLFCYTASLFALPMFPGMPFLLIVLDYWPLNRLGTAAGGAVGPGRLSMETIKSRIWEKFPFFGIMAVLIGIVLLSHDLSASPGIERYPLTDRLLNTSLSYVKYIQQILVPTDLAVFYPFPAHFPLWKVSGSLLILLTVTLISIRLMRRFPFLIVGWLWFTGMIFPLSGIAQVGTQARADHYLYLPMIGLLVAICWTAAAILEKSRIPAGLVNTVSIAIVFLLAFLSWQQAGRWKDSLTIMSHAVNVTENNYEAHNYLGQALAARGDLKAAVDHFEQALSIKPDHIKSHINLANTWLKSGDIEKAVYYLKQALEKQPNDARIYNNLGALYEQAGDINTALYHYRMAVAINPGYDTAYENLAVLETRIGDLAGAVRHFKQVLRLNPHKAETCFRLAMVLKEAGRIHEAVEYIKQALVLDPGNLRYRLFLEVLNREHAVRR